MDSGTKGTLCKFVENTKLCLEANTLEERGAIQRDPDRRKSWSKDNLMKLYKAKCKVPHLDHDNPRHRLGGEGIESRSVKKHLGMMMKNSK
ncbi:rna-directed dna polymerase from mobile element jockey-like [Willisornis vidua]|uniref:Rna-directed dna polymerase from mobile element jockey-like n=1 Tax=Willisornis vidua TaxID=1566151 RepID=A0ABQ9DXK3_9PASS|nr:rna-directed dna polymerase from mobile element jockey-like [Willisornis vidua]